MPRPPAREGRPTLSEQAIRDAAEKLQTAVRQLQAVIDDAASDRPEWRIDLVPLARVSKAASATQDALRLLEAEGAQTRPG